MFIYLAAPYWTDNATLRGRRARDTARLAARLMEAGFTTFSPISHGVLIAPYVREDLRDSHDFWIAQDFELLKHAWALFVYCLEGWQFSQGVTREIEEANRLHIPIEYISGEADVEVIVARYSYITDEAAEGIRPGEAAGTRGLD